MTNGHVIAIVQLPPPISGLSAVNARMVEELGRAGRLAATIDLSPPQHWPVQLRSLGRISRTCGALLALANFRLRGTRTLYMPCDGGAGLVFNLVLAAAARALGYRLWTHHHSFAYLNRHSSLMNWLIGVSPSQTVHLVLCHRMSDLLEERYKAAWRRRRACGVTLPNAFMMQPSAPPEESGEDLVIGHLSNLSEEKGAIRFIQIFSRLRRKGLAVSAALAGPAKEEKVAKAILAAEAEFPESFKWLGAIYGAEKEHFYSELDVFVFPSAYVNEAQPLVLLEALSQGAAILTTDMGCMGCDHAESPGRVFPEATFDAQAEQWIENFITDPSRQTCAKAAESRFVALKAKADKALAGVLEAI